MWQSGHMLQYSYFLLFKRAAFKKIFALFTNVCGKNFFANKLFSLAICCTFTSQNSRTTEWSYRTEQQNKTTEQQITFGLLSGSIIIKHSSFYCNSISFLTLLALPIVNHLYLSFKRKQPDTFYF